MSNHDEGGTCRASALASRRHGQKGLGFGSRHRSRWAVMGRAKVTGGIGPWRCHGYLNLLSKSMLSLSLVSSALIRLNMELTSRSGNNIKRLGEAGVSAPAALVSSERTTGTLARDAWATLWWHLRLDSTRHGWLLRDVEVGYMTEHQARAERFRQTLRLDWSRARNVGYCAAFQQGATPLSVESSAVIGPSF